MPRIEGVVQHYEWGDTAAIPELLGVAADGNPWAELWLGTHPSAPTVIAGDGALSDVSGPLPHLMKVLAAAQPLSLQAHPSAERARDGFAQGTYVDPYPKPEMLCALTPFRALCGVRPQESTDELLRAVGADDLADRVAADGIGEVVAQLYRGGIDPAPTLAACSDSDAPPAVLATDLAHRYPNEPSVVVTLLLNLVDLVPGEAIFLGAGNLHSYLGGVGIEVMTASDNVVRGGLTTKHVDIDELLTVFDPTPLVNQVLTGTEVAPGVYRYAPNEAPFVLWRLELEAETHYSPPGDDGALMICTRSNERSGRGSAHFVASGDSIDLPASSQWFAVTSAPT